MARLLITSKCVRHDLKPEIAYFFTDDNGQRSGFIVFDLQDTPQIPEVAEPWFLAFNAKVHFQPIMNLQDLVAAGPSIAKATQEYGKSESRRDN